MNVFKKKINIVIISKQCGNSIRLDRYVNQNGVNRIDN